MMYVIHAKGNFELIILLTLLFPTYTTIVIAIGMGILL